MTDNATHQNQDLPPFDVGSSGFSQAAGLLEFDQIRESLASYTRTMLGRQSARELTPSAEVLEIATRQQETSEARRFLDQDGGLEFGPVHLG